MSSPVPAVIAFCRNERRDRPAEAAEAGSEEGVKEAAGEAEVSWRGGMVDEAGSASSKSGGGNNVYGFGVVILIHDGLSFSSAFVRKAHTLGNKIVNQEGGRRCRRSEGQAGASFRDLPLKAV